MRHLVRGLCVLAVALSAAVASGAALAESRLFTVRTDNPSVTVVRAVRGGVDLPVAGQSSGSTFFRIDNPAGAVPCTNRIVFVASNGQSLDTTVDLCATNWEVVIGLAGGGGTPGAPAQTATGQPVVIAVDDPNVSIQEVFLRGQPVPINARQDPYVRIVAPTGPQGLECERDLGLALSDGRRVARMIDICRTKFLVVFALAGGPRPPPPPQSFLPAAPLLPQPQPLPQPLPTPQPQPVPPPPPPPVGAPAFVDNMLWMFDSSGGNASLAYGIPNTDAGEFAAVCQARSGQMTVTLDRAPPVLTPGRQIAVRISVGDYTQTYTATGSPVSELSGQSHPVMQIAATDPLWPALAAGNAVNIVVSQLPPYGLSLRGSAANVRPFLAFCAQQAAPQPLPPPTPGPGATLVGFRCNDGAFLSVAFDQDTAVVNEAGFPPLVLLRTPSQGGIRYVGGGSELIGLDEQIFWSRAGAFGRSCVRS